MINRQHRIWLGIAIASVLLALLIFVFFMLSMHRQGQNEQISQNVHNELKQEISADILVPKNPPENEVTVIETRPETSSVQLRAIGDMMLDRNVYLHTLAADNFYFPFEKIGDFLLDADITLGNLEGAITTNKSISNGTGGDRFYFTFSPNFVEPLTKYFDVVSYANNHTLNFGIEGLQQSRAFLDESGLDYFGSPTNDPGNLSIVLEKNGITIGLIGYHQLVGYGFDNVLAEIKNLRPIVDVIIIYPHWGAEYNTTNPTTQTRNEAYALIDAGADLILGGHPHVIQPVEIYHDKVIFYSLGNFIFDQYFSLETMQGLAVDVNITKVDHDVSLDYTLIPIHINTSSQPYVIEDVAERQTILDHMSQYSTVSTSTAEQITAGYININLQ